MLFTKTTASNNAFKDANSFAPSCSSADKNSEFAILAGIAVAMSVFLSIIFIDAISIIILLNILIIICKTFKRKKQFIS